MSSVVWKHHSFSVTCVACPVDRYDVQSGLEVRDREDMGLKIKCKIENQDLGFLKRNVLM